MVHRGCRLKCFSLKCDLGILRTRGRILKRLGEWEVVMAISGHYSTVEETNVGPCQGGDLSRLKYLADCFSASAELACRSHLADLAAPNTAKSAWNSCIMSHQFVFDQKEAERGHQPISFYLLQPFLFH